MRRLLTSKFVILPAAALALYSLAGFVILPAVARWYVPRLAAEKLQCHVALGDVRINPFLLTLEVADCDLSGPDGAPLAAFRRLFVDVESASLRRRAIVCREFRLEQPVIHVAIEADGTANLARLLPAGDKAEPPPAAPSEPFRMVLGSAVIAGGTATMTDRRTSTAAALNLEDVNLTLEDVTTLQEQNGTGTFTARTSLGETIRWQGEIRLAPFASRGSVAVNGVQAATLHQFVRDRLRLAEPRGTLAVTTDYRFDGALQPAQMVLENLRIELAGVALKAAGQEQALCEVNRLEVGGVRFDLAERAVKVGKLLVAEGKLRLGIDAAGRSNLDQLVQDQAPKAQAEPPRAAEPAADGAASSDKLQGKPGPASDERPWTVAVDAIDVNNIACALEDASRAAPLNAAVGSVSIHARAAVEAGSGRSQAALHDLAVELSGIELTSAAAPGPIFRCGKVTVTGADVDSGARTATVANVGLNSGEVEVSRERDGAVNWVQLLAPRGGAAAANPGAGTAEPPAAPWEFLVKTVELNGFRIALSDFAALPGKPLYRLRDLRARVSDVDGRKPMPFDVSFEAEEGGRVALQGQVNPKGPVVEARVDVGSWRLTPLQPYVEPFTTLVLQSAAFSTRGTFRYGAPDASQRMSYEGSMGLADFKVTQTGDTEYYHGWEDLQIPWLRLVLAPNSLEIREVRLAKPFGQVVIAEDGAVNLARIAKKEGGGRPSPAPAASPGEAAAGGSFPFSIGRVRVDDGYLTFADLSLRPKFATRIHNLKGSVTGLSSAPRSEARIDLDGRVDQYGLARINGSLDVNDFKRSTDVNVVFRNVEMASITPYSGKFAGRQIKSGKLSLDLNYRIDDSRLVGENEIIVDNLVLGDRVESPQAANLPLDLAVALLADASGRINIGLPVSGNLADPQFRLGPLIGKALVNAITKAVTAPFRALGSLLGGGGEKLDAVAFEPGETVLAPPEQEKLAKVADMMSKRPQLQLRVQGRYSTDADGAALKDRGVRRALAAVQGSGAAAGDAPGTLDLSDSGTRRALGKLFVERFGQPAVDELERAVEEGKIKPRPVAAAPSAGGERKRTGRTARLLEAVQVHRLVPGMKSPEEAELLAGEMFARLVERETVTDEALVALGASRAQAVVKELQTAQGLPPERLATGDPEPLAGAAGLSAKISLDALPAAR